MGRTGSAVEDGQDRGGKSIVALAEPALLEERRGAGVGLADAVEQGGLGGSHERGRGGGVGGRMRVRARYDRSVGGKLESKARVDDKDVGRSSGQLLDAVGRWQAEYSARKRLFGENNERNRKERRASPGVSLFFRAHSSLLLFANHAGRLSFTWWHHRRSQRKFGHQHVAIVPTLGAKWSAPASKRQGEPAPFATSMCDGGPSFGAVHG